MLDRSNLWPEQEDAISFIYERDQWLLLADVGTGKTVMALTTIIEWFREGIADRVLVLAPTRVCQQVWAQEIGIWHHLCGLSAVNLAGRSETQRKEAVAGNAHILLLNYENLWWFMGEYEDAAGCNVLICDEIDKLKGHQTQRFKGDKYQRGMKHYRENFEIVGGMTGTPTPNHLLDLWAQVFIVDGGKRLGPKFWDFRQKFFYPEHAWSGHARWKPFADTSRLLEDAIEDITFRIEAATAPGVRPEVRELPPRWLALAPAAQKLYRKMERDYLVMIEDRRVSAADAAGRYGKLRQLAQGFAYPDDQDGSKWISRHKFRELKALVSELQGQQLMIVYHFKAQAEELRRQLPGFEYIGGGVSQGYAQKQIKAWNAGDLELLGIHPQSAGHGLNLQHSGAHHICMLTLPESAGLYQQVVGRLARTSNEAAQVYVHKILAERTVDAERLLAVEGKITSQAEMLERMKARQS